jgi:nitrate/nitrite transport system substrate-binding protein
MNAKTLLKQVLVLVGLVATTLQLSANPTPSGKKIRLGFIPLTDCAPLVAAKELGLFAKYGVDVELSKEASW